MSDLTRRAFIQSGSRLSIGATAMAVAGPTLAADEAAGPDIVKRGASKLLEIFRARAPDSFQQMHVVLGALEKTVVVGDAIFFYRGGDMILISRPKKGTAATRTGRSLSIAIADGAALARASANPGDKGALGASDLGRLKLPRDSKFRTMQGIGAGRWNIALSLAPAPAQAPSFSGHRAGEGRWQTLSS
jgi:hypothetical protein